MASWILGDDLVLIGVNQPNPHHPRPDGARIEFGLMAFNSRVRKQFGPSRGRLDVRMEYRFGL